jgi:hypothetical protein
MWSPVGLILAFEPVQIWRTATVCRALGHQRPSRKVISAPPAIQSALGFQSSPAISPVFDGQSRSAAKFQGLFHLKESPSPPPSLRLLPHLPVSLFLTGEIERLSTDLIVVLDAAPFGCEPWRMSPSDASTRSEDLLLAIAPFRQTPKLRRAATKAASATRSVGTKVSAPMGARKAEVEKRDIRNKRLPIRNFFNNYLLNGVPDEGSSAARTRPRFHTQDSPHDVISINS